MLASFYIPIAALIMGALATALVLKFSVQLGLVQNAVQRSSHQGQKPTGGGIGPALACTVTGIWLFGFAAGPFLWAVLAIMGLAIVGAVDDRQGLPIRLRLAVQLVAMALLCWLAARANNNLEFSFEGLAMPIWAIVALFVLAGALWINLFNFMDGIDGLAASQTVYVCFAMLVLVIGVGGAEFVGIWIWCACVGCAAMAFLGFNWSPAKIFMGDAGAYFFSGAIALFGLYGALSGHLPLGATLILLALFVTDACLTLARRIATGQLWWGGHRTHAYQWLSRRWGHSRTVLTYMAINIVWLLPWAALAQGTIVAPWLCVVIAYAPLIVFVIWAKAGQPEHA